jgi:hypothetical protein
MKTATEFLLAPAAFAVLAVLTHRASDGRGVVAVAAAWAALLSAYILASVPGSGVPLHSFERTPLPALIATISGTLVATVLLLRRIGTWPLSAALIATTGVYLLVATLVGAVVLLWLMG